MSNKFQDVDLDNAIGPYMNDPVKLQQFLQSQQDKVFKDIIAKKDSKFEKVYGNLTSAGNVNKSSILNKNISEANKQLYQSQKNSADSIVHDRDLANRKYEMNEWSVNNKKDTLFVFSMLFIMLSGLLLITGLWRLNILNSSMWMLFGIPLIIIFIITIIYRSQYTNVYRDKRYWNRKSFGGKYGKIPIPTCPGALDSIRGGIDSANKNIRSGILNITQGAASTTQSLAQNVGSFAKNIADTSAQVASAQVTTAQVTTAPTPVA